MCRNNRNCGCCCERIVRDLNIVVVTGVSLTITVPDFTPVDCRNYTLKIGQLLPPRRGDEAVFITIGATTYPVLDKVGNTLRSGRIRGNGARFRMVYGSDPVHFLFHHTCPMEYSATPSLIDPLAIKSDESLTLEG